MTENGSEPPCGDNKGERTHDLHPVWGAPVRPAAGWFPGRVGARRDAGDADLPPQADGLLRLPRPDDVPPRPAVLRPVRAGRPDPPRAAAHFPKALPAAVLPAAVLPTAALLPAGNFRGCHAGAGDDVCAAP